MRVLLDRLENEPAVASGVLLAIIVALGEALIGDGLQQSDLPAILAPSVRVE